VLRAVLTVSTALGGSRSFGAWNDIEIAVGTRALYAHVLVEP
jgi:hypothetical protein